MQLRRRISGNSFMDFPCGPPLICTREPILTHENSENVYIPLNPRIQRPVGHAFVDVASSLQAGRACLELSGQHLLERKVSVQSARAPAPVPDETSSPVKGQQARMPERYTMDEDDPDNETVIKNESSSEDEADSSEDDSVQALPPAINKPDTNTASKNWNVGSSVSIRTKLGGSASWPNLKDIEDPPEYPGMAVRQKKGWSERFLPSQTPKSRLTADSQSCSFTQSARQSQQTSVEQDCAWGST